MPTDSQFFADNAIANVRLERLPLSKALQEALRLVAAGKMTSEAFLKLEDKAA